MYLYSWLVSLWKWPVRWGWASHHGHGPHLRGSWNRCPTQLAMVPGTGAVHFTHPGLHQVAVLTSEQQLLSWYDHLHPQIVQGEFVAGCWFAQLFSFFNHSRKQCWANGAYLKPPLFIHERALPKRIRERAKENIGRNTGGCRLKNHIKLAQLSHNAGAKPSTISPASEARKELSKQKNSSTIKTEFHYQGTVFVPLKIS